MKRQPPDRKTAIDPAHADGELKLPHDREQLRRRLLKMILQNEAQRRSVEGRSRLSTRGAKSSLSSTVNLAVFDPEDFIGKEQAANDTPQKPA
ncbi:MAG TPA: hypothetical protein VMJ32_00125 [Pirellulales bacterium]|nr:hypothetical protein [Pirellulales bacterium]